MRADLEAGYEDPEAELAVRGGARPGVTYYYVRLDRSLRDLEHPELFEDKAAAYGEFGACCEFELERKWDEMSDDELAEWCEVASAIARGRNSAYE